VIKIQRFIIDIAMYLYVSLTILSGYFGVKFGLYIAGIIGILYLSGAILRGLIIGRVPIIVSRYVTIIIIVLAGLSIVSLSKENNYAVFLTLTVSNVGMAVMMLMHVESAKRSIAFVLVLLLLYFSLLIISGVDSNFAFSGFSGASRNGVSALLVPMLSAYLLLTRESGNNFSQLLLSLSVFIVCTWAVGRSGIITSGILLLYVLMKNKKYAAVVVPILLFIVINNDNFIYYFHRMNDFTGDTRASYISDYLSNMDLYSFIFSYKNLNDTVFGLNNALNLHNSFLNLHNFTGILIAPLFLYILFLIYSNIRNNIGILVLFLALLLRLSTDSIALFGSIDWIFYLFIGVLHLNSRVKLKVYRYE
jgi:hypothetical protein